MESSYAPTFDAERWRTAAIVVSAIAAVELAVLCAIGVTALGKSVAHRVQTAALQNAAGVPKVPMFRRGYRPEAARLATDVHAAIVAPLDGMRPSALMGAQVVLVVGH